MSSCHHGNEGDGEHEYCIVQVGNLTPRPPPERELRLSDEHTSRDTPPKDADEQQPRLGAIPWEWVDSMRHKMENERYLPPPIPGTIFIVPRHLREVEPYAYEPLAISLGPYHREQERPMDRYKARYLDDLLSRIPHIETTELAVAVEEEEEKEEEEEEEDQISYRRLLPLERKISEKIPKVLDYLRSSYLEPDQMGSKKPLERDSKKLMKMVILDACFIVELLFKLSALEKGDSMGGGDDPTSVFWRPCIIMDMLLLENQIPFFILREVLDIVMGRKVDRNTWLSLFLYLFEDYWPIPPASSFHPAGSSSSASSIGEPYHLLHLFHQCILPHLQFPDEGTELLRVSPRTIISNATKLVKAGVAFEVFYEDGNVPSLGFRNGTMKMPPLTIGDGTRALFRNLIAFEQCHPTSGYHVTSYAMLMYSLVKHEEDVTLLQECGVLKHSLGGSYFVAELFTDLCKKGGFQYNKGKLYKDVTAYCKFSIGLKIYVRSKFLAWWAELAADYLRSPWTLIGVVAAFILLVLAVLQTVFTILPYVK